MCVILSDAEFSNDQFVALPPDLLPQRHICELFSPFSRCNVLLNFYPSRGMPERVQVGYG